VVDVEEGYAFTIYNYANDLTVREILRDVMRAGPDSLRRRLEAWLEPWDDRFLGATRPVVNPLDPNEPPAALARITRVPITMGEELEADLRDDGFIDRRRSVGVGGSEEGHRTPRGRSMTPR
jgi:hypothetical protein